MSPPTAVSNAFTLILLLGLVHCSSGREEPVPETEADPAALPDLGGTTWQLVKFEGGDATTLTPDDPAKYTIAFQSDGRLSARIDCNRGMGTWKSSGPPQLEFGPLALTRAMCPPGSLHDQIVKQWPYVRSYVMRDGHLFMSLMADGGIYEFEPVGPEGSMQGAIKGTATYRERMALPPGAVLEATLEDVSKADAPSEVIGRARVENPGNPPIRFEIPYDTSRIDPRRSYTVRARIMVDGKPFFLTDEHYPVLSQGKGNEVELRMRRAPAGGETTVPLENTYWKLTHLGDAPVVADSQQKEPHLILNTGTHRAAGSGGCNQFGGGYELNGDRLKLDKLVSTMMACMEGMETERAFMNALGQVNGWRLTGKQLELTDAGGKVVARFDGLHME
jgi:putative lipoprotein